MLLWVWIGVKQTKLLEFAKYILGNPSCVNIRVAPDWTWAAVGQWLQEQRPLQVLEWTTQNADHGICLSLKRHSRGRQNYICLHLWLAQILGSFKTMSHWYWKNWSWFDDKRWSFLILVWLIFFLLEILIIDNNGHTKHWQFVFPQNLTSEYLYYCSMPLFHRF